MSGKLRDFAFEGSTALSVNLPPVALPRSGGPRLLHLHTNTPGVLATVTAILAEHGINIEGQLLSTRGQLGYAVTDIGANDLSGLTEALLAMPETVRLRVLPAQQVPAQVQP